MQVTVEDGYIADITVLSFQDDREFFQKAQSAVINDILAGQGNGHGAGHQGNGGNGRGWRGGLGRESE